MATLDIPKQARILAEIYMEDDEARQNAEVWVKAQVTDPGALGGMAVTSFTFNGQSASGEGAWDDSQRLEIVRLALKMANRGQIISTRTVSQRF